MEKIEFIKSYVRSENLMYLGVNKKFDFQGMLIPC